MILVKTIPQATPTFASRPATAHARIPSRSASNFSVRAAIAPLGLDRHGEGNHVHSPLHRFVDVADGGLVVADDDGLELRRVLKKSWRMKRAEILSPPVMALTLDSFRRRPCSVSMAVTKRAPRSPAKSVGWRSPRVSTKVSIEAVAA